jgi:HK97 family phage prohead protease
MSTAILTPPTLRTFLSAEGWKTAARKKDADLDPFGVLKSQAHAIKLLDPNERILEFVISTPDVDRENDRIDVGGWDINQYMRNPVVLFGHDHFQPVVARALGVWAEEDQLRSRAQFTPRELNPFGFMVYQLYAEDYMRATSVGFRPLKWNFVEDGGRKFGVDFNEQELLEYSMVPVPANGHALMQARSKSGIDTTPLKAWAEHTLDLIKVQDARDALMKQHIEALRAMSDPNGKRLVLVLSDLKTGTAPVPPDPTPAPEPAVEAAAAPDPAVCPEPAVEASTTPEEKIGRVLSRKNEDTLRAAYEAIGQVLSQLARADEEDEDEDEDDEQAGLPPPDDEDDDEDEDEEEGKGIEPPTPEPQVLVLDAEAQLPDLDPKALRAAVRSRVQETITALTGHLG